MRLARIRQSNGAELSTSRRHESTSRLDSTNRPGVRRDGGFAGSIVAGFHLVKERVAQAVGIRIPLTRPLVGGKRCGPERIGAVAAMHRQVEPVAEKQLRPFPPG